MLHLCFPVNLGVAFSSWAQDWCGPLPVLMICWFCRFGGAAGGSSHEQSLVVKKGWDAAMPCGFPDRLDLKNESNESVRISMNMYEHVWTCMNVHEYFQSSAFQLSSCPALPGFSLGDALLVKRISLRWPAPESLSSLHQLEDSWNVLWWTFQRWREYVGWVILLGCLTLFWLWTVFLYPSISIFLSRYNICQYNIHTYIYVYIY